MNNRCHILISFRGMVFSPLCFLGYKSVFVCDMGSEKTDRETAKVIKIMREDIEAAKIDACCEDFDEDRPRRYRRRFPVPR